MSETGAAVVIPARNESNLIEGVLKGLAGQSSIDTLVGSVVVVNNGSADETRKIVEGYGGTLGSLTLHIIDEEDIGIGSASDTGFRFAIDELGAEVIARLDADTIPSHGWLNALHERHAAEPTLGLLTGPVIPGLPGEILVMDRLIIPAAKVTSNIRKSLKYRTRSMMRFAPGHNMSTTAMAYDAVGGIARNGPLTDDVDYHLKIVSEFGSDAIGYESRMRVYTSQRRVRELGYFGTARYYSNDLVKDSK